MNQRNSPEYMVPQYFCPQGFFIFINIHINTLILRYFKLLPTAMKKKVCYAKYSVPLKILLLYYVVVKCGSLYKMIKIYYLTSF